LLGRFANLDEASRPCDSAARAHYGKSAKLNWEDGENGAGPKKRNTKSNPAKAGVAVEVKEGMELEGVEWEGMESEGVSLL
jgi:hypothetical protein